MLCSPLSVTYPLHPSHSSCLPVEDSVPALVLRGSRSIPVRALRDSVPARVLGGYDPRSCSSGIPHGGAMVRVFCSSLRWKSITCCQSAQYAPDSHPNHGISVTLPYLASAESSIPPQKCTPKRIVPHCFPFAPTHNSFPLMASCLARRLLPTVNRQPSAAGCPIRTPFESFARFEPPLTRCEGKFSIFEARPAYVAIPATRVLALSFYIRRSTLVS
jgi:hypothetical protein